jgi:peptide chain release factor 2
MYMRFFENRGWQYEILEETQGEEAGVKSIVFKVGGQYAYGYLKKEAGTHRLVRQSPFNADKLRQTSFALVEVLPELAEVDLPDIKIDNDDLDIQFFRSGGHGGQNVNKVSTAVRLVHKPTGLTVTAQTERSQEQNRKNAMDLLRAKLWAKSQEEEQQEKSSIQGDYSPATWGTQIRSYVLHPYKMVKDLRTEVETSNTDAVLDGELDEFIEAELKL